MIAEVAKKIQTSFSSEQVNSPIPLSWKVFSDNSTSQSKDLQSSGIVDTPQFNEFLCNTHEASNLNNADACNADQGQFSSYERSARTKIPALRNDVFFMVLKQCTTLCRKFNLHS
jgi:hypothetical protein